MKIHSRNQSTFTALTLLTFLTMCWFPVCALSRTSIHVSKKSLTKLKDMDKVMELAVLTPIVDRNDEVLCMEINTVKDKELSDELQIRSGDCISELKVYRKSKAGRMETENHEVKSPMAAMLLFTALQGADRVDVDVKRKKVKVPMTYWID